MRTTQRWLLLAAAGMAVQALAGCGTTARDEALARRAIVNEGRAGSGRIAISPPMRERTGTGTRTALGLSSR